MSMMRDYGSDENENSEPQTNVLRRDKVFAVVLYPWMKYCFHSPRFESLWSNQKGFSTKATESDGDWSSTGLTEPRGGSQGSSCSNDPSSGGLASTCSLENTKMAWRWCMRFHLWSFIFESNKDMWANHSITVSDSYQMQLRFKNNLLAAIEQLYTVFLKPRTNTLIFLGCLKAIYNILFTKFSLWIFLGCLLWDIGFNNGSYVLCPEPVIWIVSF